jgi:hypothetical protein
MSAACVYCAEWVLWAVGPILSSTLLLSTTVYTISPIRLDPSESCIRRYLTCAVLWCHVAVSVEARTVEDEQPFASTRQWVTLGLALLLGLCTSAWYAPPTNPSSYHKFSKEQGPEFRLPCHGVWCCCGVSGSSCTWPSSRRRCSRCTRGHSCGRGSTAHHAPCSTPHSCSTARRPRVRHILKERMTYIF